MFWKTKAFPSAHVTAWRVFENKLATKGNLARRGVELRNVLCIMCRVEEESYRHFLVQNSLAGQELVLRLVRFGVRGPL